MATARRAVDDAAAALEAARSAAEAGPAAVDEDDAGPEPGEDGDPALVEARIEVERLAAAQREIDDELAQARAAHEATGASSPPPSVRWLRCATAGRRPPRSALSRRVSSKRRGRGATPSPRPRWTARASTWPLSRKKTSGRRRRSGPRASSLRPPVRGMTTRRRSSPRSGWPASRPAGRGSRPRLLAISSIDRAPVETALGDLREGPPTEQVLMPEALELADEIEAIEHELASLGRVDQFGGEALAAARGRLEAARAELFKAEQAVRVPELSRSDIDELEHAHAEVLQAQDRADSRLGGQRAAKRLTDARDAEQRVLDRLGFNTYADFMMGTSILHIDAEAEHRLDVARQELASAEDAWDHLQADVDAELNRAAVVDRRRALRRRAVDILGFDAGDEIVWALRQHRIQVDTTDQRAARLREALEDVGLALGQERFDDKELVELTEVWLAEDTDTAKRRRIAEKELTEVVDEIFQLRERIALLADEGAGLDADAGPAVVPSVRRAARLDDAWASVQAAEARVARHADAEREVEERTEALEVASAAEREAAESIVAAEEAVAAAVYAEQAAAAALEEVGARVQAATGLAADAGLGAGVARGRGRGAGGGGLRAAGRPGAFGRRRRGRRGPKLRTRPRSRRWPRPRKRRRRRRRRTVSSRRRHR